MSVVEHPNNLTYEEMKTRPAHAADAAEFAFENTPEAFDVICVNVTANELTTVVVDELMTVASLWQTAIHFEAVRVDLCAGNDVLFDEAKNEVDVEFSWLDVHQYLS